MAAVDPNFQGLQSNTDLRPKRSFVLTDVDRNFLLIALATLFAVRLIAVFWLPFVDTTEARYAEIARKMVETGDWITPQFDHGVPFWGKPPLHTWLSAAGMKIFGVGHFGARIFIFATSLGILGLLFAWVRQHRGSDQALLATVVLASTFLFFGASAFVMTDIPMVLGTTLSMVGFYNCMTAMPSQRMWGRMFFVGLAIGLLAKGPVAVVITLIAIVPWLVIMGRWRQLNALPWLSGTLIALALTLPWYIAAEIKTPGFLQYFIVGEHYERFIVSGWEGDLYGSGHAKPKGIIWLYWLATLLPWTFFALALIPRARAVVQEAKGQDAGWYSYLVLWSVAPLILFTPAANLLAAYVLPGLPAASVLLVCLWVSAWGAPGKLARGATVVALAGVGAIFLIVTALSFYAPASLNLKTERELVAAAKNADPNIQMIYWGSRSFSAEFYTSGTVRFAQNPMQLETLKENSARDGIAARISDADEIGLLLGSGFTRAGQFGRRILFIENNNQG